MNDDSRCRLWLVMPIVSVHHGLWREGPKSSAHILQHFLLVYVWQKSASWETFPFYWNFQYYLSTWFRRSLNQIGEFDVPEIWLVRSQDGPIGQLICNVEHSHWSITSINHTAYKRIPVSILSIHRFSVENYSKQVLIGY